MPRLRSLEPNARRTWIAAALGVVLMAIAVRSILNFSTTYPPAIDAAYYPAQTRMLLTRGHLMYQDLPLIFWLNAALAKLLTLFGWTLDAAVLMASRVVDCVVQPWTAAGVMAAGYQWSGGRRRALPGCSAAAVLSVLSPPIMRMLSDFEKNSLGLVWMALALWMCVSAMHRGGWPRWAALAGVVTLGALTHVGAFAVTGALIFIALVVWNWPRWRQVRRSHGWIAVVLFSGCVAALIGLMFLLSPQRAIAILRAPLEVWGFGGPLYWMDPTTRILVPAVYAVCGYGLWRVKREKAALPRADFAVVTAAAVTAGLLVSPVFSGPYLQRLSLMSPVPAAFVLAFIMARRAVTGASTWAAYAMVAAALMLAALGTRSAPPGALRDAAADELRGLRRQIAMPETTLVVAHHGLEWWAAYFLYTPVRADQVPSGAFTRYRRVLLLRGTNEIRISPAGTSGPRGPLGRLWDLPIDSTATNIYTGRYFELYELPAP